MLKVSAARFCELDCIQVSTRSRHYRPRRPTATAELLSQGRQYQTVTAEMTSDGHDHVTTGCSTTYRPTVTYSVPVRRRMETSRTFRYDERSNESFRRDVHGYRSEYTPSVHFDIHTRCISPISTVLLHRHPCPPAMRGVERDAFQRGESSTTGLTWSRPRHLQLTLGPSAENVHHRVLGNSRDSLLSPSALNPIGGNRYMDVNSRDRNSRQTNYS